MGLKTKKILFPVGISKKEFCQRYGVSRASYYRAKKRGFFFIKKEKKITFQKDYFYVHFLNERKKIEKYLIRTFRIDSIDAECAVSKALITSMEYDLSFNDKKHFIAFIVSLAKGYARDFVKYRKRRNQQFKIYIYVKQSL